MNLLAFKPSFLEELIKSGAMRKKEMTHFLVCMDIKKGFTQEKIAEKFNLSSRNIRIIKAKKCPNCGLLPGQRPPKTI